MRVLHVIHDFLPRHRAGSQIYVYNLCRQLSRRHDVTVLCAEYDPRRPHGALVRRSYRGTPVVELINNWAFSRFEETYRSGAINARLRQVLLETAPDVVHVHNLATLSLDLPALAAALGIPVVATLHDYTLVCPAGGQCVHVAERHVCRQLDPGRCSRCFAQSAYGRQLSLGPWARAAGLLAGLAHRAGLGGLLPAAGGALGRLSVGGVPAAAIARRLEHLVAVYEAVELFVSPSRALADDLVRFGLPAAKVRVSDYGFPPLARRPRRRAGRRLRIGFVGTLVWHKGVHVLIEAAASLPRAAFEVLVFGGTETFPAYVASLRHAARGLPVRFMGGFGEDEAAGVYAQLDVLVVPSLWPENSPLVIHEARQAGVVVVGSRHGGTVERVRHERDGLLYDASAAALARALARLIETPELIERLAAAAPPVKSLEQDAAEWEQLYAEVAAPARRPARMPR